jgi:hypothetical protein
VHHGVPPDFGTAEIRRLREILNPGQPELPADPLAALLARGFIDQRSYNAGRYFGSLTAIARHGWNLADGSVAYAYRRLVAGILGEEALRIPINGDDRTVADRARSTLEAMRAELLRDDRDGAILRTVMSVCVDGAWLPWVKRLLITPRNDCAQLGQLRDGLGRLAELRTSRRREVAAGPRLAAE